MNLLRRILTVLLGVFALSAAPCPAQEARRIVAVGDLHGDDDAWLDILAASGVADARARWTGGDTILIQLGDVPDRGPDSLRIIRQMKTLEKAAAKAGGQLIALIGNHEAMNVTGDLRYVSAGEYGAFKDSASADRRDRLFDLNKDSVLAAYRKDDPAITEAAAKQKFLADYPLGKIEHRIAWAPTGEIGQWVIPHPAIVKIGDTLFVHGGISVETAARPIDTINAEVRAELAKGESNADSILTAELGPLWYRGNIQRDAAPPAAAAVNGAPPAPPPPPRPGIADELTQVLAAYGAQRLVVAHTPNLAGIVASQNGRLIRVDTGISSVYGGVHSYLEIKDGRALAWHKGADGKWVSEALPSPGGAGP